MCGIAGFCNARQGTGATELERIAYRMAAALRHRGPDDGGTWSDAAAGVGLGHRRLAILDLSSEGRQPMQSAEGRYVIIFNGEIYNFNALRSELTARGHTFRGHSDTEVLLAGICEWGIVPALQRSIGMFALALWDRHLRSLYLARDRAGEKPLYYGWAGDAFLFGSEQKALCAHPCWKGAIDRDAVALLTRYGYIPAPFSIYENIRKLLAGMILTLTEEDLAAHRRPEPKPYWSWQEAAQAAIAMPFEDSESEAANRLESLLSDSIGLQMVADVPLGAFLSGGIDSSLVVAMMQAQSSRPIKTFCIGFDQSTFNEAPFAKAVASHLKTDHTEFYVQPDNLLEVISRLPAIYDEPFADSSQIPTMLLCELARTQVTVSLSGDAGDELFGGYEDYRKAQRIWQVLERIPQSIRNNLAKPLQRLSDLPLRGSGRDHEFKEALNCASARALSSEGKSGPPYSDCDHGRGIRGRACHFLNRLGNLSMILPAASDRSLCRLLMSPHREPAAWLARKEEPPTALDNMPLWEHLPDLLHRMMYCDSVSYLPDDILVKVDRAAMSVSLETRIPFLDHRIIEFAWRLPKSLKQRNGHGKWLLRQVLSRHVPPALFERPKKGFNVPIAEWLRGPLRGWAEEMLSKARLRQEEFFDAETVRLRWNEHLQGRRDWGLALWHVLTFQAWMGKQRSSRPGPEIIPFPESSHGRWNGNGHDASAYGEIAQAWK